MKTRGDARGNAITGATPDALALYEQAVSAFLCHRGAPLESARAAVRAAPAFVAARQLEAWLLLVSRDRRDAEPAARAFQGLAKLPANARERAHSEAIAAALQGESARVPQLLDALLTQTPHDVVALAVAGGFDHLLGDTAAYARRATRALADWTFGMPGYHAVLAMQAFALEESGEYGRAEEAALGALDREPLDLRAHHAIAHVHEMRGDPEAGIRWMGKRSARWAMTGAAATHHWWHLALFHLERGDKAHALRIYDRRIAALPSQLSELIDASGLLWRLELAGAAPGARWQTLAERWAPFAEDAFCPFNDLHAMMAFAGAGRDDLAQRLLDATRRTAARPGAVGAMARLVSEPAGRAIRAFGLGDYASAEQLLRALPPVSHRIGGSHAQRDVLELTRFAARQLRLAA
jgi:tetratricopeptide (TPR) repeat protein